MWGLGCLIWEVYNGPLPQSVALKSTNKVHFQLVKVSFYDSVSFLDPQVPPDPLL